MDTKERKVSVDSRKGIGNFILYIIKEVIPYTGYGSLFQTTNKYELEWIRKFAEQLLVTDGEDKKIFTIPAATFLINKDLNPHCDSMNPKRRDLDNTLGVHASIPISKIPECCKQQVRQHYPGKLYIPLCAVFHNRNALVNYSKRQRNVDEFISSSGIYKEGRNKIVGLLRCVNTDADYVGMLYSSSQRIKLLKNFKLNDFGTNMLTLKEAVDKIGWWSSLLHMSYLFFFKYGLRKKDIFSLILFFLHQCNTTVLIVCALEQLIVNKQNKKDFRNLYKELCFVCAKLRDVCPRKTADLGCSIHPQYQTSNNIPLSKIEIERSIQRMQHAFLISKKTMKRTTSTDMLQKLKIVQSLKEDCKVIMGIGDVRSMTMINFASLLGILPLDYYVYVPMHLSGVLVNF